MTAKTGGSGTIKRSVLIAGHATSVSLEEAFWIALKGAAARRGCSVAALVAALDSKRGESNLSSAIRVFLLEDAGRSPVEKSGHRLAGDASDMI